MAHRADIGRVGLLRAALAVCLVPNLSLSGTAASTRPTTAPAGQDAIALRQTLADLKTGDWILQWEAVTKLSRWKAPAAVAPLRELLMKHPSPWMRGKALMALAEIQGPQVLDQAVSLSADKADELREAAVEALGVIGAGGASPSQAQRAADATGQCLKDTVPAVRYKALLSHARIRKSQGWDVVAKALADSDRGMVLAAIRAMAYVGTDESRRKLAELLGGRDAEFRLAAVGALRDARDVATIGAILERTVLEKEKKIRTACEAALQAFDKDQLTAPLIQVLRGEQVALYPTALKLLAANPTSQAGAEVASRIDFIARNSPESLATALEMLGRLDPDLHFDVFVRHLDHKQADVRLAAVEGVSRRRKPGPPGLYALLKDRLVDADLSVRMASFEALRSSTERPPEGGLAAYLADALKSTDPSACWNAISLMRGRLAASELPKALAVLDRFLGSSDEKVRDLAISVLMTIADKQALRQIAVAQGYIIHWAVIGPFPNDQDNSGLTTAFGPEEEFDLAKKYKGLDDKDLFWLRHELSSSDGTVELNSMFWEKTPYKVAYAAAELKSDQERTVYLNLEGAGTFVIWLNGAKAGQMTEGDKQQLALKLTKGSNRLLIKACKSAPGPAWWCRARLTDKAGQRADGLTIEK